MPQVIPIVILIVVTIVLQILLAPSKPKTPNFEPTGQDRTLSQRQAITARRIVYGRGRYGGPITFLHVTGSSKEFLHLIVTVAGHPFRSMQTLMIDENEITVDANGDATGDFAGLVTVKFGLGTTAGDAAFNAALIANCPGKWTAEHRQSGCAKIYVRLKYDANKFPGGIPNVSVIGEGVDTIEDPRQAGSPTFFGWTDNAALCLAHYKRNAELGLGITAAELDSDTLIAAANICDEIVPVGGPYPFTANAALNTVSFLNNAGFPTGRALRLTSTGTLPPPLVAGRVYYWIDQTAASSSTGKGQLAATLDDATAGTAIDFTGAGSGTHSASISTVWTIDTATGIVTVADKNSGLRMGSVVTVASSGVGSPDRDNLPGGLTAAGSYYWIPSGALTGQFAATLANARARVPIMPTTAGSGTLTLTRTGEPRYTCNGPVETDAQPGAILEKLLTCLSGYTLYTGGQWRIYAGAWRAPSASFSKADLDGDGITLEARRSRRDLFNGVKGTIVSPDDSFQTVDFPAVQVAAYLTEDNGERIWQKIDLPFTDSPTMAQRIARIYLERNRRQMLTVWPLNLGALQAQPPDVVSLTHEIFGWAGKTFEIESFEFETRGPSSSPSGGGDDDPRFGCTLMMREIDAAVFAWDATVDENTMTPAPRTTLPDPSVVAAPSNILLSSGTDVLGERLDGTIFSRILVEWDAPADIFVTSGGRIEVEYRKILGSPSVDWRPLTPVRGDQVQAFILDVDDGDVYEVALTARNHLGARSTTIVSAPHTVLGKTLPPSDVTGFSATQNGTSVNFRADKVPDLDLDRIEVRRLALGATDWTTGIGTANILRGQAIATETVPPGSFTFLAKAVDSTGNESLTAARFDLVVTNPNTIVATAAQAPDWLNNTPGGSPSPSSYGMIVHPNGSLVPDDQHLASYYGDELFDQFCPNPFTGPLYYEAATIDLGLDGSVRVFATIAAALGAGETAGFADVSLELDYRTSSGAFQGFQAFSAGSITARYIKARLVVDPSSGKAFVTAFTPTADAQIRSEFFNALAIANPPVALTFAQRFFTTPNVQVTPVGATGQVGQPTAVSTSQCTPGLFNPATGAAAAGSANVVATGV